MMYTLTKGQHDVLTSNKQCIIVRGDRRTGKSFTGQILVTTTLLSKAESVAYIIVPTLRHGINMIDDIVSMFQKDIYGQRCIWKVNKQHHTITFANNSEIIFLTPTNILSYEFKGYQRPDLIFIDELDLFDKKVAKRIFAIIKDNYFSRDWNCRFFMDYTPTISYYKCYLHKIMPRYIGVNSLWCEALFRLAGCNKNWYRTEFKQEDIQGIQNRRLYNVH